MIFIEELEPKCSYGLLQQFTEVHVFDEVAGATKSADVAEKTGLLRSALSKIFPYFSKEHDANDNASNYALLQDFRKRSMPRVFRVYPVPFTSTEDASDLILTAPSHILIPRNFLPKSARSTKERIMCKFLFFFSIILQKNKLFLFCSGIYLFAENLIVRLAK